MNLAFATSLMLALLAVASVVIWSVRRKHLNLLWLAVALLSAACTYGFAVSNAWALFSWQIPMVWVALLAGGGGVAMSQSLAMRFGRRVSIVWSMLGIIFLLLGAAWSVHEPSQQLPWWLASLGLTVVLAHRLPVLWHLPSRHYLERLLLAIYVLICLAILFTPLLSQGLLLSDVEVSLGVIGMAGAMSAAMFGCSLTDGSLSTLRMQRSRDACTGLLSRSAFDVACGSVPAAQQISVIVMCDLDDLQRINNQFGPNVGNAVLRSFAALLQTSVREGDHVARIGADEFVLALRGIDVSDARQLVQRISHAMRQGQWVVSADVGQLTASFGLAVVRENDLLASVLHRAEVLLWKAKDAGGKRIEVDEAVAPPSLVEASKHLVG